MTSDLIARTRGLCHDEINAGRSSPLVVASLELCTAMERQTEAVEKYLANCKAIMAGEEPPRPASTGPMMVNEREILNHIARDGYPPNREYAKARLAELDAKESTGPHTAFVVNVSTGKAP